MADEQTAQSETGSVADSGSETTPATATEGQQGQSAGTTVTDSEEAIFDPGEFDRLTQSLTPELQAQARALKKSLQGAFTKKTQEIAKHRQKIEAYDAFQRDPVTQIQQMARQMGYSLTRAEAQAQVDNQNEWQPQSWDEVLQKAESKVMERFAPLLTEMQNMKKTAIETQLTDIDPTWHQYEDTMIQNLSAHPTLAKDPIMLYRLSVPPEVFESRATQKALAKLEARTQSSRVSGSSLTSKTPKTGVPEGPISFADAVKIAKARLEEEGIRPL